MAAFVLLAAYAVSATLTQAELDALNKGQSITLTGPTVTPPTGGKFTLPAGAVGVYVNGRFMWPGDWSWNSGLITVTYNDTAGSPLDGPTDIRISTTGSWNGWQPYAAPASNPSLPIGSLKYLNFAIKVTRSGTNFTSAWQSTITTGNGETPVGIGVSLNDFCPSTVINTWIMCKIPLGTGGYTIPAGTNFASS